MLTVFAGPMFAGKTSALLDRARALNKRRRIVVIRHALADERDPQPCLINHDGDILRDATFHSLETLAEAPPIPPHACILIDEGQFFDDLSHASVWADRGYAVFVATLVGDWRRRMFPPVAALLPLADEVVVLTARCEGCGAPAAFTMKRHGSGLTIDVGGIEKYAPACRACWK
jgi:thymidine kinase